jgi:hypothetical protein
MATFSAFTSWRYLNNKQYYYKHILAVSVWRSRRWQSVVWQSLISSSTVSFHTFFISLLPLYLNPVSVFISFNLKENAMSVLISRGRGSIPLPCSPPSALQDAVFPISALANKRFPICCSSPDIFTSKVFHFVFRVLWSQIINESNNRSSQRTQTS